MRIMLLCAVFRLLGLLPARVLVWMSYPLGRLVWVMSSPRRRNTLANLAACYPQLKEHERRALGRESMRHFALSALESGICWYWPLDRIVSLFDEPVGEEHLRRAIGAGKGVMLLLPHFGAWEMLTHWLLKHDVLGLYKPGRYRKFEAKLLERRQRFGTRMAPVTRSGLRAVYGHLRSAGMVAVLPDQEPSLGQGRFAPFFGIQALTGVFASRLARKTGCEVILAVCKRQRNGRYRVHYLPASDALRSSDMDESLAALNHGVELCVETDPGQYLWPYKRFKTRPEGEPRFYPPRRKRSRSRSKARSAQPADSAPANGPHEGSRVAHGLEPAQAEARVGLEVMALAPLVERSDEDQRRARIAGEA